MKLLTFLAFVLPIAVYAQSDSSRWSISPEVAIGGSFQSNEHYKTYGALTWSGGLKFTHSFKKMNGGLSTGVYYSSRTQRMEKLTFGSNLIPGSTPASYDTTFNILQEKQMVEVPLMYSVRDKVLGIGKVRTYVDCGFAASFYLNDKQSWDADPKGSETPLITDYRVEKTNHFAVGGKFLVHAGLVYPMTDRLWLALMVNVDMYFQPPTARFFTSQPMYTMEGCLSLRKFL